MKKIYATALMVFAAMSATAQDAKQVKLDFNANPWGYGVSEVTKGWAPDYTDWDSPGAILTEKDFSWPIAEGSTEKIKVTLYPVDIDEYNKVAVYASYEIDEGDAAALYTTAGKKNILYTQPGTTMRFQSPDGYEFAKIVFHCYRSSNILVGDEYEEEFEYEYNGSVFPQKLKVWNPTSPKKNQYNYNIWEGDETNILFNYPYFNAHFVSIDIALVPAGSAGVNELNANAEEGRGELINLGGQRVANGNSKGVYIVNGKKKLVK